MNVGDKFDIFEFVLNDDGTIEIGNIYNCEVEFTFRKDITKSWEAVGYSETDNEKKHFKFYDISKVRPEGKSYVVWSLKNDKEEVRKIFEEYYEKSAKYFEKKMVFAKIMLARLRMED